MSKMGLYICDPEKNTECSKQECHINGGQCDCTKYEKYARDDSPEDAAEQLQYEEGETIIVPKDEYRQLVFNAHLVDCLEEMGVDNWQGYGDSYKMAEKRMEAME